MPTYEFQCECGLRFESFAAMVDYQKPQKCPECGKDAPRHIPLDVQGVIQQEVTGPTPQNTGVSQIDTHIDRVIGQSAHQGWDVVGRRVEEKRQVLRRNPGTDGRTLSRNPDGSYSVLPPDERGIHERANVINSLAMKNLKKRKEISGQVKDSR